MECPVCGNRKISPFATHCLECGADVLAFPLLDDLEEQCVVNLKEKVSLEGELTALSQLRKNDKKRYQQRMNRMYWFLFLLPLMFFWCGKKVPLDNELKKLEVKNTSLERNNASLETKNNSLESNIVILQNQIDSLSRPKGFPKEVSHIVRKKETLYLLAKLYLGNGENWKRLVELNPRIDDPDYLQVGDTIVIKLR